MVICIWPFDLTLLFHICNGRASAEIRCPYIYIYIHTRTQIVSVAMLLVTILLVRRVCKLCVAVYIRVRSFFGISQIERRLCACDPQDFCSGNNFFRLLWVVECHDVVPPSFLQLLLANILMGMKIRQTNQHRHVYYTLTRYIAISFVVVDIVRNFSAFERKS